MFIHVRLLLEVKTIHLKTKHTLNKGIPSVSLPFWHQSL